MVRPERFELPTLWFVARCSIQLSYGRTKNKSAEISIISETLASMKARSLRDRHTVNTLRPALNISFLTLCMSLWHRSCLCEFQRKSFSPLAIPTLSRGTGSSYFQGLEIGKSSATLIDRRSGAQRGALEDKLRPEVFLDAPCIFPSARLSPGRQEPSPSSCFLVPIKPAQVFLVYPVQLAAAVPQSPAL